MIYLKASFFEARPHIMGLVFDNHYTLPHGVYSNDNFLGIEIDQISLMLDHDGVCHGYSYSIHPTKRNMPWAGGTYVEPLFRKQGHAKKLSALIGLHRVGYFYQKISTPAPTLRQALYASATEQDLQIAA